MYKKNNSSRNWLSLCVQLTQSLFNVTVFALRSVIGDHRSSHGFIEALFWNGWRSEIFLRVINQIISQLWIIVGVRRSFWYQNQPDPIIKKKIHNLGTSEIDTRNFELIPTCQMYWHLCHLKERSLINKPMQRYLGVLLFLGRPREKMTKNRSFFLNFGHFSAKFYQKRPQNLTILFSDYLRTAGHLNISA